MKSFNYVQKMCSGFFKNVIYKMYLEIILNIYVWKVFGIK